MRRAVLLVAAFLLAVPAGANAAYPGVNGRIALASDRSGVTKGSVLVRDRKAHRSVVVRRGKSCLAAARGR